MKVDLRLQEINHVQEIDDCQAESLSGGAFRVELGRSRSARMGDFEVGGFDGNGAEIPIGGATSILLENLDSSNPEGDNFFVEFEDIRGSTVDTETVIGAAPGRAVPFGITDQVANGARTAKITQSVPNTVSLNF